MNTILLVMLCSSAAMDECQVWKEAEWTGPAAPVYCTVERDVAEARLRESPLMTAATYGTPFVRFECESQPVGE